MTMLFRKKIERSCAYCVHGTKLDDDQILCVKKGICPIDHACRKFKYDPCKRVPAKAKALDFAKYDEHDYSL
jgi:hypothetical protein